MEDKNTITGIPDIEIVTNGTPSEMQQLKDVNTVGSIIDGDNTYLSDINALFMIINQNARNCQQTLTSLISAGANLDKSIMWHGEPTSAREFLAKTSRTFTFDS